MDVQLLRELGLDKAASQVEKPLILKRKMALAYEHYRFVEPQIMENFKTALKAKTLVIKEVCPVCKGAKKVELGRLASSFYGFDLRGRNPNEVHSCSYCRETGAKTQTFDTVKMTSLKGYDKVPPMDCLLDLQKAKGLGCFDNFEVAEVESVVEKPDPIIFGMINGCNDKFFITQWDSDIKIEDILKEHEG